jgi:hypothetical protein
VQLQLLPSNRVQILALTDLPNQEAVPISVSATLVIEKRRRILFQDSQFEAEPVPPAVRLLSQLLSTAFLDVLNSMVDLDRFNLDGVMLRLNRLETQGQNLLFSGYAQIQHFPGSG